MTEARGFAESIDELHEEARTATGLDDFGDSSYLTGLEVLAESLDEDDNLSSLGKLIYRGQLLDILSTRLRVEARLRERADCAENPIARPIIITGLVRTGSTALHYLIGQDPDLQKLEYWLAAEPQVRPPRDRWLAHPDFDAAVKELEFFYGNTPELMAVHEMKAEWPEECRHILAQNFTDDRFETSATLPRYNEWYRGTAHRETYRRHRKVIGLIGADDPERRWLLKYPVHLRQLSALFEVYPDACIVQTHRDPRTVLASYASFISKVRAVHQTDVDVAFVAREQMESWASAAEAGMRYRDEHGSDQFFDLQFTDFMADPIGSVKQIYARFDQTLSPEGEASLAAWHEGHPQGRHGRHQYQHKDFGVSETEILDRFAAYMTRYDMRP